MNFGVDTVEKFHGKYLKMEDVFFVFYKSNDLSIKNAKTQVFFHTQSQL